MLFRKAIHRGKLHEKSESIIIVSAEKYLSTITKEHILSYSP